MYSVGVAAIASPDDDKNNNNQLLLQDLGIKRRRRNRILAARNAFDAAIFQIQQDEDDGIFHNGIQYYSSSDDGSSDDGVSDEEDDDDDSDEESDSDGSHRDNADSDMNAARTEIDDDDTTVNEENDIEIDDENEERKNSPTANAQLLLRHLVRPPKVPSVDEVNRQRHHYIRSFCHDDEELCSRQDNNQYVHRTSKDNNGVIKYYLRCEQCSCPNCIELKFDECICVDDVGAWLPVTTKALQTKHDQMQQENTRTLHTALRQELDPLKHAYTEYNKYSGKIQALLSGVSNKQKYKKEDNRYCCCLPSDKEARGIPAKKEYRRYIQCEDPTAACFIKYHAECVINGDDVYAAKNPTTSTSSTNGNKRSLAQFQDEPWCCKYCTDYRENDMKVGESKQEYLQKAHAFITVHPLQPFPEDCIVQEFAEELDIFRIKNVNNMDTSTS